MVDWDDMNSFVTLFPALAANIGREILSELETQLKRNFGEKLADDVYRMIENSLYFLGSENPYCAGRDIPLFSHKDRRRAGELNRKEEEKVRQRRRATEDLWQLGPEDQGQLLDEGLHGARSEESMSGAKSRLQEWDFKEVREGQFISFQRSLENYIIYADPRPSTKIDFYIYKEADVDKLRQRKRLPKNNIVRLQGQFHFLDQWTKNLAEKWMDRFNEVVKTKSHR